MFEFGILLLKLLGAAFAYGWPVVFPILVWREILKYKKNGGKLRKKGDDLRFHITQIALLFLTLVPWIPIFALMDCFTNIWPWHDLFDVRYCADPL